MGGYGSGRRKDYWDVRRKPLVEDALTLDAAKIDLESLLEQSSGILRWTRGKEEISSMLFVVRRDEYGDALVLRYNSKTQRDHCPVEMEEEIQLEKTTPHFGGRRRWFSCPGCGRRTRTLHIPKEGRQLRCRDCHGLTYRSVREHDKRVDELVKDPNRLREILVSETAGGSVIFSSRYWLALRASMRLPNEVG